MTLLPSSKHGKELLQQEIWRADIYGEQAVEAVDCGLLELAGLEMPAFSTRMSRRSPTMPRTCLARRCGRRGRRGRPRPRRRFCSLPDVGDDGFGLLCSASVMDEQVCARAAPSAKAVARPIPREAPVTRAILPDSSCIGKLQFVFASECDDDLAELSVRLEVVVRGDDVVERRSPIDHGLELPPRSPRRMKAIAAASRSGSPLVDPDIVAFDHWHLGDHVQHRQRRDAFCERAVEVGRYPGRRVPRAASGSPGRRWDRTRSARPCRR